MPHSDEDEQVLVSNEQPFALDDGPRVAVDDVAANAGGFVYDNDGSDASTRFVPAAQLHEPYDTDYADDYGNVEPQTRQVLVSEAPPDSYKYTYIVFYLLGIGTMTPWNFFVTAEDYWNYKFRNTTLNESDPRTEVLTPLQKSFTCDLTVTASISGSTFLILNVIYGQHVSLNVKMVGMLAVILALFGVTTGFVEVNTDSWQEQFFLITLLIVVVLNICSATMSGGIFGVAGLFPSQYMTAVVSGQALGGIFTALAFILVLTLNATPQLTAFIFFNIGFVLVLLCIICYISMARLPFFKYYLEGGDKYKIVTDTPSHSRTVDTGVPLEPVVSVVFGKIYCEVVCICLLFATTLSVYPAVTVLMQSQSFGSGQPWSDVYYMPVVNYLLFNSGDYFGRLIAGWWERPYSNPHTVLLMTFIRVLYVPFLMCSNSNAHNFLPVLVHSDVAYISMIATFALSNGYLANILLMMAPRAVQQHEKELASSIMAASLSCGLAVGSMLSLVFVQLL